MHARIAVNMTTVDELVGVKVGHVYMCRLAGNTVRFHMAGDAR